MYVAAGTVSAANGDFATIATDSVLLNAPTYEFVGPTSVGAITFDPRRDGGIDRLEAAFSAFPTTSIYGQSDWSVEM